IGTMLLKDRKIKRFAILNVTLRCMSAKSFEPGAQQKRVAAYLDRLAQKPRHLDRVVPLKSYCTGSQLPGERKSVERHGIRMPFLKPKNRIMLESGVLSRSTSA